MNGRPQSMLQVPPGRGTHQSTAGEGFRAGGEGTPQAGVGLELLGEQEATLGSSTQNPR